VSDISTWILTVAGISVMSVLVDLMLPNGQTKKYIKGVFAFIVVLVIISPIPKWLNREFVLQDIFDEKAVVIQEDFIYNINRDRLETLEEMVEADLAASGIENVHIKINANIFTKDMKIDAVFVDLSQVVIKQNKPHIDINELVVTSILKYIAVERADIIFDT
jgi:hypothetical protein